MWIIYIIFLIALIPITMYLYSRKVRLQQEVDFLKPLVETMEHLRDIVYYCETNPRMNYLYLSPAVNDFLGPGTLEKHLQNPELIFEIVHPDDRDVLMKKRNGQLNFKKPIKVRFRNTEGEYIWFEEYATPVYKGKKFVAVKGIFRNIHDKVHLQEELEYKSTHDSLTDLYNREYFQSKMNYFNQRKVPIAVIVADLDELKAVNDHYGHQMGDSYVRNAANTLKACGDREVIIFRLGGDEFAIIIPNATVKQAERYIEAVRKKMQETDEGFPFSPIQISIGYKYSSSSYGVMEQLLNEADARMYENKRMRKNLFREEKASAERV